MGLLFGTPLLLGFRQLFGWFSIPMFAGLACLALYANHQEREFRLVCRIGYPPRERIGRGRAHLLSVSRFEVPKAEATFRAAVEMDPTCAAAHAGVALVHCAQAGLHTATPTNAYARAKAAALSAFALDDSSADAADAQVAQSAVMFLSEWDWVGAERSLQRTLALNPTHSVAKLDLRTSAGLAGASLVKGEGRLRHRDVSKHRVSLLGHAEAYGSGVLERALQRAQAQQFDVPDLQLAVLYSAAGDTDSASGILTGRLTLVIRVFCGLLWRAMGQLAR